MRNLLAVIVASIVSTSAYATTVNWGANNNFDFVLQDSTGALLQANSLAQIGYFNLSDTQIQALASPTSSNIAALNAAFTPFANARLGDGFDFVNPAGPDDGSFTKPSSAPVGSLLNNQIYYWVVKSTNNSSVANSLSTAFEQTIFYRNKMIDLAWQFPNDISSTTIDAGNLRGSGGTISAGSVVLAGSYVQNSVAGAIYNGGPTSAIQLQAVMAAVPEPSAFAFGVIAAFGALCSRPRRSSKQAS